MLNAQKALNKIRRIIGPHAVLTACQISIPDSRPRYHGPAQDTQSGPIVIDYMSMPTWLDRLPSRKVASHEQG